MSRSDRPILVGRIRSMVTIAAQKVRGAVGELFKTQLECELSWSRALKHLSVANVRADDVGKAMQRSAPKELVRWTCSGGGRREGKLGSYVLSKVGSSECLLPCRHGSLGRCFEMLSRKERGIPTRLDSSATEPLLELDHADTRKFSRTPLYA